jgi:ADP-ribose pyrophosphatase YjhB (NUDIX family)
MKFCSQCGHEVDFRVPEDDNLPRFICDHCGCIHYQNPNIVTGCIPQWAGKILLCKRAIEPRYGLWTLPAGFMENQETLEQAATRETMEEANARVDNLKLYAVYSIPHINQVYMMFTADLLDLDFSPGSESLEVSLHSKAEIPWHSLAFPVIEKTLQQYYLDEPSGEFPLHLADLYPTR